MKARTESVEAKIENKSAGIENGEARTESMEAKIENGSAGIENGETRIEIVEEKIENKETKTIKSFSKNMCYDV